MPGERLRVLLIEDNEDDYVLTRELLRDSLDEAFELEWTQDFDEGLRRACGNGHDVCLLDYRLGARNGVEWLKAAAQAGCRVPTILLTGQGDREVDLAAAAAGAADFLDKNTITAPLLERSIRYAVQQRRFERQRIALLAEQRARAAAEAANEALRESRERLRLAQQAGQVGVFDWDIVRDRLVWTPEIEDIFGIPPGEFEGGIEAWAQRVHPEDLPHIRVLINEWMRSNREQERWEYRLLRPDGQTRWVAGRGRVFRDASGRPLRMVGTSVDITDRKTAEIRLAKQARELQERAQELARSNAELEQFASIVSHDLRSPLVSLAGCAQLLSQELDAESNEKVREILTFIRSSVDHMSRLIKSLLEYSRVGRGGVRLQSCDTEGVFREVLDRLRGMLESTGAQVTHEPLPPVLADHALLAQLLQNLLENGIKYHAEAPPRVHVSARQNDKEWLFLVRDHGIGIDPRYSQRIFQVFQRLHPDESRYAGIGVGLATCKKIVEQHGGRIWVESEPGRGSSFYFTLPRRA